MHRLAFVLLCLLALCPSLVAQRAKAGKASTPPPAKPPLEAVDIAKMPAGMEQTDVYLLMGQSNMKGRGHMPAEPKRDPRLVMMHLNDDQWYLARHPLHLAGDARTFAGHDNAGVGPGLAFAEVMAERKPKAVVALVPCAVGGTPIRVWAKGEKRYDNALRRAKLALQSAAPAKARIAGVLWLQGEADAKPEDRAVYEEKLLKLVDHLRADLGEPDLPFVACTIGEMIDDEGRLADKVAMNQILLALPQKRPRTACVDARDIKTHIGDGVHFDTAAQEEIGRRFAKLMADF